MGIPITINLKGPKCSIQNDHVWKVWNFHLVWLFDNTQHLCYIYLNYKATLQDYKTLIFRIFGNTLNHECTPMLDPYLIHCSKMHATSSLGQNFNNQLEKLPTIYSNKWYSILLLHGGEFFTKFLLRIPIFCTLEKFYPMLSPNE